MIVRCKNCGKEIDLYPSRVGKNNFCNKACFEKHQSSWTKFNSKGVKRSNRYRDVINVCLFCNLEFHPLHGRKESKFCSKECCYRNRIKSPVKKCTECKNTLDKSFFYKRKDNKYGKYFSKCKDCHVQIARRWRESNRDTVRNRWLKFKYKITLDDYKRMEIKQGFCCGICKDKKDPNDLVVDHNHTTGKVRSLLCNHCNRMLGSAKEDVITLRNAISYVKRHL